MRAMCWYIDTGTVFDGYFCDFNLKLGDRATVGRGVPCLRGCMESDGSRSRTLRAHLVRRVCDVWKAQAAVLSLAQSLGNNVGRLGHGLGMQLTEPPSNHPSDETILEVGTVLTIEPGMEFAPGLMMVHEEDIAIRDGEPTTDRQSEPAAADRRVSARAVHHRSGNGWAQMPFDCCRR